MGCQLGKTNLIQVRSKSSSLVGHKFQESIENNNPNLKYLQQQWKQYSIDDFESALKFKQNNPQLFTQLLQSGAISNNRQYLWKAALYIQNYYQPECYQSILKNKSKYEDEIEKDLQRTLPNHTYFHIKQSTLYNVLKALSIYNKGYVTGIHEVTGFFLLINGLDEEETFWMMNYLNANPQFKFLQLYLEQDNNGDRYEFVQKLMKIFHHYFQLLMPELYNHFEEQEVVEHCYVWKWVFSLFLQTFPFEVVLYFFDFVIANNILAVISLSLALLKYFEKCLLKYNQTQFGDFIQKMPLCENVFIKSKKETHLHLDSIIQQAKIFQQELNFQDINSILL